VTWTAYGWLPDVALPTASGATVERQPGTEPAAVPVRLCLDCHVELATNQATRCPVCAVDEEALLALDGAYWDLRRVITYGRLLNHCAEGQEYIRLITDTCRDALAYAREKLA
jgi:hypothetical protein